MKILSLHTYYIMYKWKLKPLENCFMNKIIVKEEIFVGEKFRTFPSKTFRMELNFVFSE